MSNRLAINNRMMTVPVLATCSLLALLSASLGALTLGQTVLVERQSWPGPVGHRTLINYSSFSSSSSATSRPRRTYSYRYIGSNPVDFQHHRPLPPASFMPLPPIGLPLIGFGPLPHHQLSHTGQPTYLDQPHFGPMQPRPPVSYDDQQPPAVATAGDAPAASRPMPAVPAPSSLVHLQPVRSTSSSASASSSPPSSSLSSSFPSSSANRVAAVAAVAPALPTASPNSLSPSNRPAAASFRPAPARPHRHRPMNSLPARPAAPPALPLTPTTAAPAPTASGALGPAVPNDSDLGFDVEPASNSDSSSLGGPTVTRPA